MKVAIKFCGGCNPDYERSEYWESIKLAAGDMVSWCRLEDNNFGAVLLICGCSTACPRPDMPAGVTLLCLTDSKLAPAEVIAKLMEKE